MDGSFDNAVGWKYQLGLYLCWLPLAISWFIITNDLYIDFIAGTETPTRSACLQMLPFALSVMMILHCMFNVSYHRVTRLPFVVHS